MDEEELLPLVFSEGGLLSHFLDDYEEREGQIAMAQHVLRAYFEESIALIEAGTGIGKSLAYLIPALYWVLKFQEKTVISTCTISLQEQLLTNDIPFALKVLDADVKVALVKGMNNYLCLRRLSFEREQMKLIDEEDCEEIEKVEDWAQRTKEGSFSEIPFSLSSETWGKVRAQREQCNFSKCPHYKKCFFFKARKKAADAQLIIVNHHLLFADMSMKAETKEDKGAIPPFQRVVLDEAHHIEEIARDSLAIRVDRNVLLHLFHQVDQQLPMLKNALSEDYMKVVEQKIEIELPAEKRNLQQKNIEVFDRIEAFCRSLLHQEKKEEKEEIWRIYPNVLDEEEWEKTADAFLHFSKQLKGFGATLSHFVEEIEKDLEGLIDRTLEGVLLEVDATSERLNNIGEGIDQFFNEVGRKEEVRWVERKGGSLVLMCSRLDVSTFLRQQFFNQLSTTTLCSATMTTNGNFSYIKDRLGIAKSEKKIGEEIYPSPFNYEEQSHVLIPNDIPFVNARNFIEEVSEVIIKAIEISDGGAFILFTSYRMLKECYQYIAHVLEEKGFDTFKQGDKPRNLLIQAFKKGERSVLFATDSFWEGVDVPGDQLRLVIITKLPFKVPTDPFVQAQSEILLEQEKNPFFDYLVPEAVIKFKQGFGRLIRKKSDRGCILCLDKRLVVKPYGKIFLRSLPPCKIDSESTDGTLRSMKKFYKETWSVAESNR